MKITFETDGMRRDTPRALADRKSASAVVALLLLFLVHEPAKAAAQAPSSIAGTTFGGPITDATSPPIAPPGTQTLLALDGSGNGYHTFVIWPTNFAALGAWPTNFHDSVGTYSYSAFGEFGTGDFTDSLFGPATVTFVFAAESSGTYNLSTGPYYADLNFELFSAAAPDSIAGATFCLRVQAGASPFSSAGSLLLKTSASGTDVYEMVGDGTNTFGSSGTYSYSKVNTATGKLLLSDSRTGSSTAFLSFSDSTSGEYALRQPSSGGLQIGRFTRMPVLSIVLQGTSIVLSWPTNFSGFAVESTADLRADSWNTNYPPPILISGNNTLTVSPVASGPTFYRLFTP